MRRPAGEPDDLESRADLAIKVREALRVDFGHTIERRAAKRRAAALGQRIGRAHPAQLRQQDEWRGIAHGEPLDVRHRQREARALQQRAHLAHVRERRHARRNAALDLALGGRERLAQFGERVAAEQRGKK